jgi:hypothetical protein
MVFLQNITKREQANKERQSEIRAQNEVLQKKLSELEAVVQSQTFKIKDLQSSIKVGQWSATILTMYRVFKDNLPRKKMYKRLSDHSSTVVLVPLPSAEVPIQQFYTAQTVLHLTKCWRDWSRYELHIHPALSKFLITSPQGTEI